MIHLYRSNINKYFSEDEIIIDNESFFNDLISANYLDKDSEIAMLKIDNAILLDKLTEKIQTSYGICSIDDLSTGCKTYINIIFISKRESEYKALKALSLNECGRNVLDEIFDYVGEHDIKMKFILQHDDDTFDCREHDYLIDGVYKHKTIPLIGWEDS